jgi:hypothetical protein
MIENVDLWIGMLVGAAVFLWPIVATWKLDHLTQAELVEISSEYDGINTAYFVHIVMSLIVIIPLVVAVPSVVVRNCQPHERRAILAVWSILVFSGLALSQGLFAVRKGVYPTSKFFGSATTYAYAEGSRIQQLGRREVIAALVVSGVWFLIGLARWWGGF